MKKESRIKLNGIIRELSFFLERDYSSHFRTLSDKEDRQLFFLAKILTQLKQIAREASDEEKVVRFPALLETKGK